MVQKLTGDIRLQSVIKIIPWNLFKLHGSKKIPRNTEKRYVMWKEAMVKGGLESIEPIEVGTSYVAVSQLTDEILQQFKQATKGISKATQREYMEWASGEVLLHDGNIIFRPMCCSSFGALAEWKSVAAYQESEWAMVWIGHPWIYMKYEDGWLYFTDYTEDGTNHVDVLYAIEPEQIAQAVKMAEPETQAFLDRYYRYFPKVQIDRNPVMQFISRIMGKND